MDQDLKHLRMLSIGFYLYAAILALFSLIPAIFTVIGLATVMGVFPGTHHQPPPKPELGWIFVILSPIFTLFGAAITVGNILTARFLKRKKNYGFCFLIAALDCMFFPLGIVMGVFTILVLLRESVKQLFNVTPKNEFQPFISMTPPDWR
jgi:hypothetical protein